MGRRGITYERFEALADNLRAAGKTVSVASVREANGNYGSNETLQPFLDLWNKRNESGTQGIGTKVPLMICQDLEAWCRHSVDHARHAGEELVTVERLARTQAEDQLSALSDELKIAHEQLGQAHAQMAQQNIRIIELQEGLQAATTALATAEQAAARSERNHAVAVARIEAADREVALALGRVTDYEARAEAAAEQAQQSGQRAASAEAAAARADAAFAAAEQRANAALAREREATVSATAAESILAATNARTEDARQRAEAAEARERGLRLELDRLRQRRPPKVSTNRGAGQSRAALKA